MQASGKGALLGAEDSGMTELAAELNALSTAAQKAAHGPGVQDAELCEVIVNLGIIPGKLVPQAAVKATQAWAELGEKEKISQALVSDV